ncbi:PAPA-1-like conserved region-domain-containing protein [Cercophora samala]|uniref:PAPA-1-like conserved region-domain-containing protein n=1 Tax=Cercophora samala TaxID=330535 RepID=A0AA39ZLR1_9PEZI|nr:PAPA-1-like conserved region-domain-containing protein [Cercophora samala]
MSSRPRRSAAQRATVKITDLADRDNKDNDRTMSSRSSNRRSGNGIASVSRGPGSSPTGPADADQHIHLTVKTSSSKLRQAISGTSSNNNNTKRKATTSTPTTRPGSSGGKRTRGGRANYVVESSEDDDDDDEEDEDEEEEEPKQEIEVKGNSNRSGVRNHLEDDDDEDDEEEEEEEEDEDEDMDDGDDMDIDAEGEEDDDEDVDMSIAPPPPAIKVTKPQKGVAVSSSKAKTTPIKAKPAVHYADDDDDEELSELESEPEDITMGIEEEDAEGEDEDIDAEGEEEIVVDDEDAEGEEDDDLDSDLGSRGGTPDLSKLTARQRAKLGEASHEYLKLSDEVQAKKVFTAEELSMRRAEMARRRRNLSEKRNEEVKMETINKLLKKQAPKTTRKNALLAAGGYDTPDGTAEAAPRADPMFVRWVNNKDGSKVSVPDEMLAGPAGRVFVKGGLGGGLASGKMVEEVS